MTNEEVPPIVWGFVIIMASLLVALFLGIAVYTFALVDETLSQDVNIGQVNLKTITNQTFGQITDGMLANADTIGIILLFSMLLLMILNGYFMGERYPTLFFVVDIFLLALFFIPSIYVSQIYNIFITSSTVFTDTFINTIPKVSKFMLNLPAIIATAGVLTMIMTYAFRRKGGNFGGDGSNVLGF